MDDITLLLLIAVATPFVCAFIARAKNKNPVSWFCWRIIFGVFALGYLLISPAE
ncbi:MAG: hypothetical protein V3W18_08305 [candidate division Zixibacteria bacterium]